MNAESRRLALAEQHLSTAQAAEDQERAAVSAIDTRIAEVEQRKSKIRADLESGKIDDQVAGGLFQLATADEKDLSEIKAEAVERLAEASERRQQAQNAASQAQHALDQAERQQAFDALAAHARRIEEALVGTVAELFALGQAIGKPYQLSASWTPGEVLRRAVMLGVPPEAGQ